MDNWHGFNRQYVPTNHGRIAAFMRHGTGPAIIFLHGNSFSGEVFSSLVNDSMLAGLPIVVPDFPGHGLSDNSPTPGQTYNYTGFGDCVAQLATALNLKTYMIFGWSLGGQVAIEMLDRAEGLIGVATCGSAIVPRGPLGLINGFHFTRDLLLAGKSMFKAAEAVRFADLCTPKSISSNFVETILRADSAMRPALSKASAFGKGRDQRAVIAGTQMPVYAMLGENDPFIRADSFAKVTGPSLFGGKPQLFTGSGHAPFLENPASFARRLALFYRHVEDRAKLANKGEEQLRLAS